jgi:hypothetical protein
LKFFSKIFFIFLRDMWYTGDAAACGLGAKTPSRMCQGHFFTGAYMRQDSKILRERYKANRIAGLVPQAAAAAAGFKDPDSAAKRIKRETDIENQVAEAVKEMTQEAYYTRDKVLEITGEAIELARIGADAGSMIRGVQEINKMQGYYAPEKKAVMLDHRHTVRQAQIQELPEAELLKRLGKPEAFIDAEFEELPPDS